MAVAKDCLAGRKLLSAVGRHAVPWYQVYVWTGGLASLLQVRVTGSSSCNSPAGETETAVSRGESGQEGDKGQLHLASHLLRVCTNIDQYNLFIKPKCNLVLKYVEKFPH